MKTNKILKISLIAGIVIILVGIALAGWKTNWGFGIFDRASQPDYWPTAGWQSSTPEEQGIDSGKLAETLMAIRENNIQIHSLVIIRHGYKVLDASFYPYDGQDVHDVASVTKSVMTTLIGIAIDQGKIDLDEKMVSYFANNSIANIDQSKNEIAIRHLASMSSGLDCTAAEDEKTLKEMRLSPDYVQFTLDRKSIYPPGEQFIYCSPAIHLLSPILKQATGQPPLDFARQYLFEPLGIHDATWKQDPQGNYNGWGDLSLFTGDMAKIGFLFLHEGQWDGKQIVSRQWVEAATTAKVATPDGNGYGYGWWMDPAVKGGYRADGRGGQFIFVLPEWDMVLATTGGGFLMDQIAPYLMASFLDFDNPAPANPEGVAALEQALSTVQLPPTKVAVAALPDMAQQISGKTYVFPANPSGIESIAMEFDGTAEATLHIRAGGSAVLSYKVGLDGVFRFSPGLDGRPSAYRGSWVDAQTFALEYDGITNNDHSFFSARFEGNQLQLGQQETAHKLGLEIIGILQEE